MSDKARSYLHDYVQILLRLFGWISLIMHKVFVWGHRSPFSACTLESPLNKLRWLLLHTNIIRKTTIKKPISNIKPETYPSIIHKWKKTMMNCYHLFSVGNSWRGCPEYQGQNNENWELEDGRGGGSKVGNFWRGVLDIPVACQMHHTENRQWQGNMISSRTPNIWSVVKMITSTNTNCRWERES